MVEKHFPDLHPSMTSTLLSLYLEHTLIALSGFPNGRKTVSKFTPFHDINIAEFIFGTYLEHLKLIALSGFPNHLFFIKYI